MRVSLKGTNEEEFARLTGAVPDTARCELQWNWLFNGKGERSQQTDWVKFYSTVDLEDPVLPELLEEWQFFYNWHCPHSALGGKPPDGAMPGRSGKSVPAQAGMAKVRQFATGSTARRIERMSVIFTPYSIQVTQLLDR